MCSIWQDSPGSRVDGALIRGQLPVGGTLLRPRSLSGWRMDSAMHLELHNGTSHPLFLTCTDSPSFKWQQPVFGSLELSTLCLSSPLRFQWAQIKNLQRAHLNPAT